MKRLDRTAGLQDLTGANQNFAVLQVPIGKKESFWQPIFSSFPFRRVGGFFRSLYGFQASGPVNAGQSWGGITVTPELSLMLSSVWACVGRYQQTVSTLPLDVMKAGPGNSAISFREHPLHRVLHDQPNSQQSATTFWKGFVGQMMTWGAGYAIKLKGADGRTVGLKPLLSAYMTAYFDAAGKLRYNYAPTGGQTTAKDYSADELFVVIDRTLDGYAPLSRLQYAANSLGMAIAADRASNLAFKNGLRASGILTIATWLKKEQRQAYRDEVEKFVGTGAGNSDDKQYGVMIAENASKFDAVNLKPQDLELLESRKFSIEDICRWYDVPPILVSHAADGQTMWGTGVEQIILGWLKLGLAPVLRSIEQEIWRQLLTVEDQTEGTFAEFNLDALLRGDSAARATFYSQMSQNGAYTRNEIRARENLPPMPGGDVLTVQSNMTPLDKLGTIPATDAQQLKAAMRAFMGLEEHDNGPQAKGP